MWCYQKPGHEAVVLTELQRQQQCSQFCDTLLKAGGVSVPAHSCILSAISPHISSALSTAPVPPAGQSCLLEFRDLGACTLLHLVRLLYSGEMVGEGESEKQEAVSAAAKLGIHGLVEVTRSKRRGGAGDGGGVGLCSEVGVQTEPMRTEENEGRCSGWQRELRDGMAFLWKETFSDGGKDMWTQTEELPLNPAPPAHSMASYETLDIGTFQNLGQTDFHQFVPMTFVYPLNENQILHPFSTSSVSAEESTVAGSTSVAAMAPASPSLSHFSSQIPSLATNPHSCVAASHGVTRDEEWKDDCFEQFEGNIPGFISYFLNPENKESTHRGRGGRRQRAKVGGGRSSRTRGEPKARAPRGRGRGGARGRGRGRGGLTQMVDVQEVGMGKLQKLFLHRWETKTTRTGQGGGAVGRKLYLKSREVQKKANKSQSRRSKAWEVNHNGEVHLCSVGGNSHRGWKKSAQQFNRNSLPVGRTQQGWDQSTPVSCPRPNKHFHDIHTLSASSPALMPSLSHSLLSPPASYVSPASSLVHNTSLLPPAPPPHEDQPESIDHILEEFMMGLNILPNDTASPLQCSNTSAQHKQPGHITVTESPVLQQQCEGELSDILDHFLQSFEEHVERCSVREENGMNDKSSVEPSQHSTVKCKRARVRTRTPYSTHQQNKHAPPQVSRSHISEPQSENNGSSQSHSKTHKSSACSDSAKHKEEANEKAKRQSKRRPTRYLFSLEKKGKKVKKQMLSDVANMKLGHNQKERQLQQMPVVTLNKKSLLPFSAILQENSCRSLENKRPSSPPNVLSPAKNQQQMYWNTKVYPIRSRLREAKITDTTPFLNEPLPDKQTPSVANIKSAKRGRPRKNPQICSSSNGEISKAPAHMQLADSRGTYDQCEKNQERHENEFTVQPQEAVEGPAGRGKKRRAECHEDTDDDATMIKRMRLSQMTEPTCVTCTPCSESASLAATSVTKELNEVVDYEAILQTRLNGCAQGKNLHEKSLQSEIKRRETEMPHEEMESSADIFVNVEELEEDLQTIVNKEVENGHCHRRTRPAPSHINDVTNAASPTKQFSLLTAGNWEEDKDEDIDVTGGSSPVPDPVIINWTESSEEEEEEEEEDIDVGENTDFTSSQMFTIINKSELSSGKHQTEVFSH